MRKVILFLSVFVLITGFFTSAFPLSGSASSVDYCAYDFTDVFDDLQSSTTADGRGFDIRDYPYNDYADRVYLINVVEYCYSFKLSLQGNYGLYLYVYNPSGTEYSEAVALNKVQMAVQYDSDGQVVDWEKFSLLFCSRSSGQYANLFYKFRVLDRKSGADGKTILERVNSIERRYDISGIELSKKGAANAVDYPVGGTYRFTGYAKGYGVSVYDESTLTCAVSEFETVVINDLRHTYFRTQSSYMGKGFQNQLDSVYFSVDDRYFEQYGSLARVKAEWYEYRTDGIFVTDSQYLYDLLSRYLGEHFPADYRSYIPIMEVLSPSAQRWLVGLLNLFFKIKPFADYLYDEMKLEDYFLPYLFMVDEVTDAQGNLNLSSDALKDYIYNYTATHERGYLDVKDGTISADLFNGAWASRPNGYVMLDIGDEKFDMLGYGSGGYSWYETAMRYGIFASLGWFGQSIDFGQDVFVDPILPVPPSLLVGSKKEVAEQLLINESDVDEFVRFYTSETAKGKRVILFRYAVTPYYSENVDWISAVGGEAPVKGHSYMAVGTVFFDFDIIQLTFRADGLYRVIPVVSSPIDIFPAITPPVDLIVREPSVWRIIAIVAVVAIIVISGIVLLIVIK